jgi:PAS domain S-box-containing protein
MNLFHHASNGPTPSRNRWRFLPIAVLSAGVILLVATLYLIFVGLERDTWQTQADYRDNVPWYAVQFERELSVFIQKLDAYRLGDQGTTRNDVADRFDVFWSRIDSADAGTVGSIYLSFEGAEALLEETRRALRDIEQLVASLKPDDSVAHNLIKTRLEGLSERFHQVSLKALHRHMQEITTHHDRMAQAHNMLMVIFAGVLTGGAILIGLILVEIRQIGALRDSLEQRVQIRTRDLREEIAQRRQAGEALQKSEARFRDFAGAASDWFWELGPDLRFSYLSERFEQSTGISPQQVLGKHHDEVSRPDTRDDVWIGHVKDMNARRQFRDFRLVHMRDDGTTVHVSLSGTPRLDEAGNFSGFRGTGTNITEHVEAERALRRSEERYRRLVDLSPDGILIHSQENIVFANPAAVRFLGARDGDDLVGRNLLELIDPKHHKATKLQFKEILARGREQPQIEQRFVGLDGRSFLVHSASTRLPREGARTILTVFRDIGQVARIDDSSRSAS